MHNDNNVTPVGTQEDYDKKFTPECLNLLEKLEYEVRGIQAHKNIIMKSRRREPANYSFGYGLYSLLFSPFFYSPPQEALWNSYGKMEACYAQLIADLRDVIGNSQDDTDLTPYLEIMRQTLKLTESEDAEAQKKNLEDYRAFAAEVDGAQWSWLFWVSVALLVIGICMVLNPIFILAIFPIGTAAIVLETFCLPLLFTGSGSYFTGAMFLVVSMPKRLSKDILDLADAKRTCLAMEERYPQFMEKLNAPKPCSANDDNVVEGVEYDAIYPKDSYENLSNKFIS